MSDRALSDDPEPSKTLIVCIDRDNDVGVRTGIQTPVVGKDACLNAATKLALSDPEEADANAIFAAIKEYDQLLGKGYDCEVVLVSGQFERGVLGDQKIRSEIGETLRGYPATGAVIISDGTEGEDLVPVIQSLVPIISLRRVIVKHSKTVEESYAVLGRYLRMLIFDPRYARYALGIPGIIFVGIILLDFFAPAKYAVGAFVILIGAIFIIRGFDIDRKVESLSTLTATGSLRLFSVAAAVFLVLGGIAFGASVFFVNSNCIAHAGALVPSCKIPGAIYNATNVANKGTPGAAIQYVPNILGYFIQGSEVYIWLGMGVYIAQAIVFDVLRQKHDHLLRNGIAIAVLALLSYPVYLFSNVLLQPGQLQTLTAVVLFLLAINFVIAAYVYRYFNRRRRPIRSLGAIDESPD
jgi:putative membrane protein